MKQRKGFTLIELMIVIAIIIILAAIAIPNYLNMTKRARMSRVAGDFNTIATALEAYRVDWGQYPAVTVAEAFGKANNSSVVGTELSGTGTANASGQYAITGEEGPVVYIEPDIIESMYNPFYPNSITPDEAYTYLSADGTGYTLTFTDGDNNTFERTNTHSDLQKQP